MSRPNWNDQLYNIQGKPLPVKSYRLIFIVHINTAAKLKGLLIKLQRTSMKSFGSPKPKVLPKQSAAMFKVV